MTDSTGSQLLNNLQTYFTGYINNLANQRIKGVLINGEALMVSLTYNYTNDTFSVVVSHMKTGLSVSDGYTTYANALAAYNSIVST